VSATIALCVPAYNAEHHLPRLLASASRQTVPFDEVLVYDDASTDRTAEVAAEVGARVILGRTNRGCSFGRNRLAEHASADWIHFHDADDELYPTFVECAREWVTGPASPDVVLFAHEWRDEDTREVLGIRRYDDEGVRRDPVAYTITEQVNHAGIFRRRRFLEAGGADEDPLVLYNEDDAMHGRLARAGLTFRADPRVTVIHYRRGGSMSSHAHARCARAKYHVLRKTAESLAGRYTAELAERLWATAAVSGTVNDWPNVDACVTLARSLGSSGPIESSWMFRLACRAAPYRSMRLREAWIRRFRPWLRPGSTPLVSASVAAS
jgi:glycosyltransferase involved in cell wall biosynthesis